MILGGYPRSRLARHTIRDLDNGKAGLLDGVNRLAASSSLVIGAQVAAGMRFVTDGMLDWHDIFRPFIEAWRNVTLDGLLRYFDNNFFYRIPVFLGEPEPQRLVLPGRVLFAKPLADPAGVKVVVPGPVTMVKLSKNRSGLDDEELASRIAAALAEEVREAVKAGASVIQVDEPYLADVDASPDDARLAVETLKKLRSAAGNAVFGVAVYFGVPQSKVYEELINADANYISIDVVDAIDRALELIESKGFGGKIPVLGVVNARQIIDDKFELVVKAVRSTIEACKADEIALTTSTWLDLIPHRFALRKTMLLGAYAERVASEVGFSFDSPITKKPAEFLG
jgi:5-methyltetrahydropteroyltriglutamate--homocysteine methyltransferase